MSGHSKWKNIAHKKEKTDAQRAKIFTKLSREITVAVREGGADPNSNSRLKDVLAKARAGNVPQDNIARVIARASGAGSTDSYESIQYEGYGPQGAAVIVETMTDNRNRTAGEMRHYFDKFGGNLGASGCVSWSFDAKGILVIERDRGYEGRVKLPDVDEDQLILDALDAGAEDVLPDDEAIEVQTPPEVFGDVRDALEQKGYSFLNAQVEQVPQTYVTLTAEEDVKNMQRLLDALEENDDVQNVWHNWEMDTTPN